MKGKQGESTNQLFISSERAHTDHYESEHYQWNKDTHVFHFNARNVCQGFGPLQLSGCLTSNWVCDYSDVLFVGTFPLGFWLMGLFLTGAAL